jgi:hypothetical protein
MIAEKEILLPWKDRPERYGANPNSYLDIPMNGHNERVLRYAERIDGGRRVPCPVVYYIEDARALPMDERYPMYAWFAPVDNKIVLNTCPYSAAAESFFEAAARNGIRTERVKI